jgi:uncharacterized protein YfdQ (DUF2303 family)
MTEITTDADAIAKLARQSVTLSPYPLQEDSALVVTRAGYDEHVRIADLEAYLDAPRRPRGRVTLHDHNDFANYTNRLTDLDTTTVWADVDNLMITAVINDHADDSDAGWRDHIVSLQLRSDPDWNRWTNSDDYLMPQGTFAEHIEATTHTIVSPDAATLLEIATTFQAKRHVDFQSGVRLSSGDVQLSYSESTTTSAGHKGNIEVPAEFTLALAPFVGTKPREVTARLRYRIECGHLSIGYCLVRPDLIRRAAFEAILAEVSEKLDTEAIYNGTAPSPVAPAQNALR